MRLTALSPQALQAGLTPGLTLADARARVPGMAAVDRDHPAEAALLGRLLAGLVRYTPMAAAQPPDGLILDIAGCCAPYGGERGLKRDAARRLAAAGLHARLALGGTAEAARALARFGRPGQEDVRALPVAALEVAPEVELALRRAGLRTVGDLAVRQRAALAARFGDLAVRLGRLLGEQDRRITPHRPLPPVAAVRRFAEPVAKTEHALQVLAALVAEAAETLARRGEGGRRFKARFFRSDGAVPAMAVETGRPTRDPAVLDRLFRERLDALSDPLDPGFGFDLIRLDVPVTEPLAVAQPGLGAEERPQEDLDALVDRLATRLGGRRLRRAAPHASHLPERATADRPAAIPVAAWAAAEPGEPPVRPILLYDPPQPITAVLAEIPDKPPVSFTWAGRGYRIVRSEGPERIAPEWWRRMRNPGRIRDYYRVEDEAGHRFWLFRSGPYGDEADPPRWYLHGRFA